MVLECLNTKAGVLPLASNSDFPPRIKRSKLFDQSNLYLLVTSHRHVR